MYTVKRLLPLLLKIAILLVWFINGFYCKLLRQVPRHEQIVARFFGESWAVLLTQSIGVLELAMCVWILSNKYPKANAYVQIGVVFSMNVLEFFFARDLLLWGGYNFILAMLFIGIVYIHSFVQSVNHS